MKDLPTCHIMPLFLAPEWEMQLRVQATDQIGI